MYINNPKNEVLQSIYKEVEQNRQQRTFNSPFLWLLAATLLARVSGKTNPPPWLPYKTYTPNHLGSVWYPTADSNNYVPIKPPTISQNQVIHIHESSSGSDEEYEIETIRPNLTVSSNLEKPGKELYLDEIHLDMGNLHKDVDNAVAESSVKYRRQKPEPLNRSTTRYKNKRVTKPNNNINNRKRYNNNNNNSKRGNRKPYITTTFSSYDTDFYDDDDDYEMTTQRMKLKRKPTTKRYKKRTTTPNYEYEDYDYPDNSFESTERIIVRNDKIRKRRPTKHHNSGKRRPTTTENSYEDYYQNSQENLDSYEEPDYRYQGEKVPVVARQAITTTESSTTGVSSTTESSSTVPSSTEPTATPKSPNNTEPTGYGYGPYSGNSNVSITYGPPGNHNYYNYDYTNPSGYGPSNGNENISITYGPPTGHRLDYVSPILDAWYSQYAAKNAVVRRIQDLIQNNIYNHDGHFNDNYQ